MRVRTFSWHYRKKYGHKVGKIPVHLGQLCPNRRRGGCIFCSSASFTPGYLVSSDDVRTQIDSGKRKFLGSRFQKYFVYFQQESCTAADPVVLIGALKNLLEDEDCIGAILSTRPDCIEDVLLDLLVQITVDLGKEILFELGVQTVHERSLKFLNRNHSFADFEDAVSRIQARSCFEIGAHLIFGIPGESEDDMLGSVKAVCDLGIDALKLHHLQVIQDTPLHLLYQDGSIELFTKEGYQRVLLNILPHVPARITLHRLWATAHPQSLVAPRWNCLASVLSNSLRSRMEAEGVWQGKMVE